MKLKSTTVLHAISYYIVQIPFMLMFLQSDIFDVSNVTLEILLMGLGLNLLLYIVNVFMLFRTKKAAQEDENKWKELYQSMLIIKLATALFFIFNFIIYTIFVVFFGVSVILTGVAPMVFILGVFVTVCYLFSTSTYSIIVIYCAYKKQYITREICIGYIVTQFIFCIDILMSVIAYIQFHEKCRRINRENRDEKSA